MSTKFVITAPCEFSASNEPTIEESDTLNSTMFASSVEVILFFTFFCKLFCRNTTESFALQ